jgi:hypothetical protein
VKGGMISIYNGDAAFDPDPAHDGLDDPRITGPGPRHRLWMTDEEDWQYERTI